MPRLRAVSLRIAAFAAMLLGVCPWPARGDGCAVQIQPDFGTITPLSVGTVGRLYFDGFTVVGATAPYTLSVSKGTLPPGISLTADGNLSGTPTAAGTYDFDVTARDAKGCTATNTYEIHVNATDCHVAIAPSGPDLPRAQPGNPYTATLVASGGTAPYTFRLLGSVGLPAGLALTQTSDTSAEIHGSATATGQYLFTIDVTDARNCLLRISYTILVSGSVSDCTADQLALEFKAPPELRTQATDVVVATVQNISHLSCTGAYRLEATSGTPLAFESPSGVLPITCSGSPTAQVCTGVGRIDPGSTVFAGSHVTAVENPLGIVWELSFGPASKSGTATIEVLPPRFAIGTGFPPTRPVSGRP